MGERVPPTVVSRPSDGAATSGVAALVGRVYDRLAEHRDEVDALNVFPVPDGDTGTNMTLTVDAALAALGDLPPGATPAQRAAALARGALRGARGNSGIILSQVLRAFLDALPPSGEVAPESYLDALERASDLAYAAVDEPVEGTILTAVAAAADAARAHAGARLERLSEQILEAVRDTVAATRHQLEANRRAGVVDAGARGFELVVEAVHASLTESATAADAGRRAAADGTELGSGARDAPADAASAARAEVPRAGSAAVADTSDPASTPGGDVPRYEVQYLLDVAAAPRVVAELRAALRSLGDSVAVVAAEDTVTAHVHTDDIGGAIEAGLDHGRPQQLRVTELREVTVTRSRRCVVVLPPGNLGAVAHQHDAVVVTGQPGALPAVTDLVAAIDRADADRVWVLPGHRNVVATAHQAAAIAARVPHRSVEVVAAADAVPRVLAALAVWMPDADPDPGPDPGPQLVAAATAVACGEIVAAIRDADTPVGPVRRGHHLSVVGGDVVGVDADPLDALERLTGRLLGARPEIVTLVVGAEVDDTEREAATTRLRAQLGDVDLELLDGGQPVCRYHVGIE